MKLAIVTATVAGLCTSALGAPTAEQLFIDGQTAYDRDNAKRAIELWHESYRLSKEPALLYNLALAYRLGGDCEHALSMCKEFIKLAPASENRSLADTLVHDLEAECGSPSAQPSNSARKLKLAGLVTGGGGAVLVMTGLLFGRRASSLGREVTSACSDLRNPCDWSMQQDKDADGRRYATIGYTLDALGLVAIVSGAVMYYLGDRKSHVTVSPTSRDGGTVTWGRSW